VGDAVNRAGEVAEQQVVVRQRRAPLGCPLRQFAVVEFRHCLVPDNGDAGVMLADESRGGRTLQAGGTDQRLGGAHQPANREFGELEHMRYERR